MSVWRGNNPTEYSLKGSTDTWLHNPSHAGTVYVWGWNLPSLWMHMSWHQTVLGHQLTECWLQNKSVLCEVSMAVGDPMTSFKMADMSQKFQCQHIWSCTKWQQNYRWRLLKHATGHYLNQWWPSSATHIYGIRGAWVDTSISVTNDFPNKHWLGAIEHTLSGENIYFV